MKKLNSFLREKGFYIALGVGIIAFAALIFTYDYKDANDELTKDQAIDLNQSRIKDDVADSSDAKKNDANKNDKEKTNTVADNNSVTDNKEDNKASANNDLAEGEDGEEIQNITAHNENKTDESSDKNKQTGDSLSQTANATDDETSLVEAGSDSAIAASIANLKYDGTQGLLWPLEGELVMPYSMDTTVYYKTLDMYKCSPGIMIEAEEGNSVFSAYEGIVESVKDTKEYGTEVIVNLGNGYKAIYGQLMNIAVKPGDEVAKATIIGQVAPVSDYFRKEGTNLFFEVTKNDKPVNPVTLID